jgi:hypothetical protein
MVAYSWLLNELHQSAKQDTLDPITNKNILTGYLFNTISGHYVFV